MSTTDHSRFTSQASLDRAGPLTLNGATVWRHLLGIAVCGGIAIWFAASGFVNVTVSRMLGRTESVLATILSVGRSTARGGRNVVATWTSDGRSWTGNFRTGRLSGYNPGDEVRLEVVPGTNLVTDDGAGFATSLVVILSFWFLVLVVICLRLARTMLLAVVMRRGALPQRYFRVGVDGLGAAGTSSPGNPHLGQYAKVTYLDRTPDAPRPGPGWTGESRLRTYDQAGYPDPLPGEIVHVYPRSGWRRPKGMVWANVPGTDRWWLGIIKRVPAHAIPVQLT